MGSWFFPFGLLPSGLVFVHSRFDLERTLALNFAISSLAAAPTKDRNPPRADSARGHGHTRCYARAGTRDHYRRC